MLILTVLRALSLVLSTYHLLRPHQILRFECKEVVTTALLSHRPTHVTFPTLSFSKLDSGVSYLLPSSLLLSVVELSPKPLVVILRFDLLYLSGDCSITATSLCILWGVMLPTSLSGPLLPHDFDLLLQLTLNTADNCCLFAQY